jgi:LPS-assembly protein
MKKGSFTTCEAGRDDWVLQASEIDSTTTGRWALRSSRAALLRRADLRFPVRHLPAREQPPQRRALALLRADFAARLEFGVPYYWNIAPEADLTVTPVYMSKRGIQLKNWGRYLQPNYQAR